MASAAVASIAYDGGSVFEISGSSGFGPDWNASHSLPAADSWTFSDTYTVQGETQSYDWADSTLSGTSSTITWDLTVYDDLLASRHA